MWLVAKRYSRVGLIMEEVMVASREAASRFIGAVNTEETRHDIVIAMRKVYMELSKKHPAYYDYNNRHWYPSSGAAIPAKDITHWMLPSIPEEDTNPLPK